MDKSQIENIAAALSELEAEKQRRIDEKVEKGEAVRVPALSIVVGGPRRSVPPSRTSWPHCERPARRARFIFEEPSVIVTGVPRAGRDDEYSAALARGNHKASAHVVERPVETSSPTAPKSPPPLSAQVASESEPRRVWATVEPPSEKTCGTILEGTWTIAGNVIRVLDMEGRLFTDTLGPNDNAEHVARRLLREKHGKNTLRCQIRLPLQVAARWYRALPKIRCSHSP